MVKMTEMLTVSEYANRLRISEATVRRWARAGFIPAFLSGAVLGVAGFFMLKSKKAH